MNKKLEKKFVLIILIILIINTPFILYLSNFKSIAFNENFYKEEFLRYDVYDKFQNKDIDEVNSELLDYLRHDKTNKYVKIDLFNQKEKEHLLDVKNLIQKSLIFLNLIIILSLILVVVLFLINKKNSIKNISVVLIFGGIITFLDALIFFILVKINFNFIFNIFHKIFFKAGTWLFNSADKLVVLYQERFFYDILIRIVLATLIMAVILMVLGLVLNKKNINKHKHF